MYPPKSLGIRNWEIKEVIGNKYKANSNENKDGGHIMQNIKFRFKIELDKKVFLKDLDSVLVGKYVEDTGKWNFENIDNIEFNKENKIIYFYGNELAPYSILLERKIIFPYKSWLLRCINESTAVLDLHSNINILTYFIK
jgi:hypothetical protein